MTCSGTPPPSLSRHSSRNTFDISGTRSSYYKRSTSVRTVFSHVTDIRTARNVVWDVTHSLPVRLIFIQMFVWIRFCPQMWKSQIFSVRKLFSRFYTTSMSLSLSLSLSVCVCLSVCLSLSEFNWVDLSCLSRSHGKDPPNTGLSQIPTHNL